MEKFYILIVGDASVAVGDVAEMLRADGEMMVRVAAVSDALQSVGETAPALIVMDIAPGCALDSLQVTEKLPVGPDTPMLYLACPDDALHLQHVGITAPHGYLLKPVSARALSHAVQAALYRRDLERRLAEREASYRGLFEEAPFSVWEEDFSAVKAYLDDLRAAGVDDVERYFHDNPDVVQHCASLVKIVNVNQATATLFGAADKAALLHGLDSFFVEQSLASFADELIAFLHRQRRFESEIVGRKLNGELIDTLFQATLVSGYEETWGKVFIMATDITARKRAEAALEHSAATLRSIFSAASIGIGLISNRVLLQVNERICEMTGYTQDELVGQSARVLYPTDQDFEYVGREKYRQIREHGIGTVETRWQRKDGQILDVWLSSTPLDPADFATVVTFTALDITERKQSEQERERLLQQIQEQTLQMQQIMDTVSEGVFLLDAELCLLLCNPSALAYLHILSESEVWKTGQKLTALAGHSISELLSPPPRGLWHEIEANRRHFQITARAIETGPMMGGWVLVVRDVTEEQAFRETVQRQDRLATVGQLAAGIAHDFNNILAGIVLYSQMSLRAPNLPAHLQERLAIIASQAHRAAELINQILDFSRSTVLDRLPLDVIPLLKEQVKLWERTLPESIRVDFTYGVDDYVIDADPTRMQQVLMNLVVNARDAMPDGGTLSIEVTRLRVTNPKYAPMPDMAVGDWVLISLSDTGSGIPDEALPFIYDPFFTTKPVGEGTGLGLSQVYGIVSSHDGVIDVRTEMKVGTTFFLYFPALAQPEAPATDMLDDLRLGHGETILVVEDNAAARAAIVASLELLNYRVLEAENGKVALNVFAEHRDEIALVLSDLVMAEMGGKALAQALHQLAPALRVVVMTGYPLKDEREALHATGVVASIQKPPGLRELAETLAKACAGGPVTDL